MIRQTHTYANLEVSTACFNEIKEALKTAGYKDTFFVDDLNGQRDNMLVIPMQGIALIHPLKNLDDKELYQ